MRRSVPWLQDLRQRLRCRCSWTLFRLPDAYDHVNENGLNWAGVDAQSAFEQWGIWIMDILFLVGCLFVGLIFSAFSCARSYFEKGRVRGLEEAAREFTRGLSSHYELEENAVPERVALALKGLDAASRKAATSSKRLADPYHAQLWILGDAIGEACWLKGHAAGIRRKTPAEGKIRVDLSIAELLQLSWLAHLGFQRMMPNFRDFEIHRFNGAEDAQEGAWAVSKIECAVPVKQRPFADLSIQLKRRQELISDWWQSAPGRLSA